ncbi:DUF6686 family protein [Putridiphycobacter roseus]|nr:DUF6686 family protein [Putridiphycobacter roseus]
MHTHKIIHQNETGNVALCEKCEHIHLEIGTFLAVMPITQFKLIVKDFKQRNKIPFHYLCSENKPDQMVIQTTKNTFITLDENEFESTFELLDRANHHLEIFELLK